MGDPGLPDGCSINDIPGCTPLDEHTDRFTDEHGDDLEMFQEFLAVLSGSESSHAIDKKMMNFLLEIEWIDREWDSYLIESAKEDFYEQR